MNNPNKITAKLIREQLMKQVCAMKEEVERQERRKLFWNNGLLVCPCSNGHQLGQHWYEYSLHTLTNKQVQEAIERAKTLGAEEVSFQVPIRWRSNFQDDWNPPEQWATVNIATATCEF